MLEKYKVLLWDFDGVLMDSMPTRTKGFEVVLEQYPLEQVSRLLDFHNENGGLSRYVKFRYFFETIRSEAITEVQVIALAERFSEVMLSSLINADLLINDSIDFIKKNHDKYQMHIVSGSDGNELRHICSELGLSQYFVSINGSPTPKNTLVKQLLEQYGYNTGDVILIGDSKNDLEASVVNNIGFAGYNNPELKKIHSSYIEALCR